jgi:predicted dehydrogenase
MADDVDAVMIALPHDLHFECGMFFAQHNKHILMEKPLCNTERECELLIEACEERNLKLMCAYPVRFWTGIVKLKELIDSGEYGEIIQMSIWTEQLTGAELRYDDPLGRQWLITNRIGGGQLFSHGCHYVDVMLWFLGNPVSGAHMGTRNGTPWMLREGTSALVMKFENGALGYHGATWGARGTRLAYDFQIMTDKGLLEFERLSGEIRFYNGSGDHVPGGATERQSYNVLWKRDGEVSKETQHEIKHFTECVLEDKTPLTNGRAALQSLRVIWALYNAEENGTLADLRGLGLDNA